jgi:hypothetical protein
MNEREHHHEHAHKHDKGIEHPSRDETHDRVGEHGHQATPPDAMVAVRNRTAPSRRAS